MTRFYRLRGGFPNSLATTVTVALAGLCSGIVLARTLAPGERGEFAAVLLWPGAVGILGELGLSFAFSYYAAKRRESLSGLWTLAWALSVGWGATLALLSTGLLSSIATLSPVAMESLVIAMVTVPLSLATGFQSHLLLGSGSLLGFNGIRAYAAVSYAIGVATVAATGLAGIKAYTFVFLLAQGSTCLVASIWTANQLRPSFRWDGELVRPVFVYGFKTYVASIAAQMNLRLDQLLMTSLVSASQLGLYVVAVAISSILSPLYGALAVVVIPRVSHTPCLRSGGELTLRYTGMGLAIGIPVATVTALSVPWLLPSLFGTEYSGAILTAQILTIAAVFQGANLVLGNGLRSLGYPDKPAVAESVGLMLTAGLLVVVLPHWGALGAAAVSLGVYLLVALAQTGFVLRVAALRWQPEWLSIWLNQRLWGWKPKEHGSEASDSSSPDFGRR